MTNIEKAKKVIEEADAILIGAGAGMSVPVGIDLMDKEAFAKSYPAMLQYGFTFGYQLMGYPYKEDTLRWGYLSASLNDMFSLGIDPTYQKLLELVKERDYFVLTSNVDRLFQKNNFDEERIYTPQGDSALFQCKTPCSNDVWDAKELVAEMVKYIDPKTQKLTREDLIPRCPKCGGEIYMNVRSGRFYIEDHYEEDKQRLNKWLTANIERKVVLLEIGVGYNTPGVIKYPFEEQHRKLEDFKLIRINPSDASVPTGAISLEMDIDTALDNLK